MKTIKELEAELRAMETGGKPIEVIDLGRLYSLKEVLGLIDERIKKLKENFPRATLKNHIKRLERALAIKELEELKKRIIGVSEKDDKTNQKEVKK